LRHSQKEIAMKPLLIVALLALSACTNPMLSAEMAVGTGGVSVKPALSGQVGGTTVTVEANN
jgi:hypothetical protein